MEAVDTSGNRSSETLVIGAGVAHDKRLGDNCPPLGSEMFAEDDDPRCTFSGARRSRPLAC